MHACINLLFGVWAVLKGPSFADLAICADTYCRSENFKFWISSHVNVIDFYNFNIQEHLEIIYIMSILVETLYRILGSDWINWLSFTRGKLKINSEIVIRPFQAHVPHFKAILLCSEVINWLEIGYTKQLNLHFCEPSVVNSNLFKYLQTTNIFQLYVIILNTVQVFLRKVMVWEDSKKSLETFHFFGIYLTVPWYFQDVTH